MTESFVVLVRARTEHTRLGITVGRRVGNAVVRNRVKRLIREWFRRERSAIGAGWDIVVIARPAAARLAGASAAFAELKRALRGAL